MDRPDVVSVVLEQFEKKCPLSVMTRATLEHALRPDFLDRLFERVAEGQYLRALAFSTVVNLMCSVVLRSKKSINAAYQAAGGSVGVSVTSVYNKINGLEPAVCMALVADSAKKLGAVVRATGGNLPPRLPGFRLRILDGNHLAATERRLDVLKGSVAGPLPGQTLAVLCPETMQITDVITCEDGHAQERSIPMGARPPQILNDQAYLSP